MNLQAALVALTPPCLRDADEPVPTPAPVGPTVRIWWGAHVATGTLVDVTPTHVHLSRRGATILIPVGQIKEYQ
jgi:hypothetical protein